MKISKIHHFKYNIITLKTIQEEKIFGTRKLYPGRLGTRLPHFFFFKFILIFNIYNVSNMEPGSAECADQLSKHISHFEIMKASPSKNNINKSKQKTLRCFLETVGVWRHEG